MTNMSTKIGFTLIGTSIGILCGGIMQSYNINSYLEEKHIKPNMKSIENLTTSKSYNEIKSIVETGNYVPGEAALICQSMTDDIKADGLIKKAYFEGQQLIRDSITKAAKDAAKDAKRIIK